MFWGTLQEELHQSNAVDRSWNMALRQLGSPYQEIFTDQGQQLLLGDAGALELLKSCRKELFQYLEKERTSAREKEKLALVLGLSAGLMCALILL